MDTFLTCTMVFLMLLASFNLFVGVSNDAVNFLSSALGSKSARYNIVMGVAAAGVLLGCTFSSGMMEIARSGIFNPQLFTYWDVMLIFFAVMLTDVLLLDTFNSLGLPTSTTVSIVFELLGASVVSAAYKLWVSTGTIIGLGAYINNEKALSIIIGILASVVIAFTFGTIIQWLMRYLFTFRYQKVYRYVGGIYSGLCLTAIFYFLIVKGAKGASFMTPALIAWLDANTETLMWSFFLTITVVFQILIWFWNFNALRIVILAGTFALAFAFAGNDLVNFVGVPLAALDAVRDFMANGTDGDTFMMTSLAEKGSKAATIFLLLSGLVMVLTLWFSKKAHRVVQTSINLSSSQQGEHEQFGSSLPGRMIVRSSMTLGSVIRQILPMRLQGALHSRFKPRKLERNEQPLPFDYVRASVNLVLSSILIASATSLQLPLSTTYVTFMVAMGSSFADGAWDRETAVYRISGVLTVISGWFLTAFTACSAAALVCWMAMMGGTYMMIALMLFAITLLIRSNFLKSHSAEQKERHLKNDDCYSVRDAINDTVGLHLQHTVDLYEATVKAFLNDNESALRKIKSESADFFDLLSRERSVYYDMAQQRKSDTKLDRDARYCYYRAYTGMREVGSNLQKLTTTVKDHIANRHRVYKGELKANLIQLASDLQKLGRAVKGRHALESVKLNGNDIILEIDRMQENLLSSIATENISMRGCELYLNFLQFARELVNRYSIVAVLQHELNELCDRAKTDDKSEGKSGAKLEKPASHTGPQNILRALHVTGFGKKS